jgi:hypothetical protein
MTYRSRVRDPRPCPPIRFEHRLPEPGFAEVFLLSWGLVIAIGFLGFAVIRFVVGG